MSSRHGRLPGGPRASRSCGNCRAVKRRCDLELPHCGQCSRLREDCPGYRDEWDLVFRDETARTIDRLGRHRLTSGDASILPPLSLSQRAPALAPAPSLSPDVDEMGVNYFFRHFLCSSSGQSSSRGYLNYIPPIYHADGDPSTLVASMAAVGLFALAYATQQPQLATRAYFKYAEAIRKVNAAIASPTESIKDSTLMSVISLGIFEQVSEYRSWTLHVDGAAALVAARGRNQFSAPVTAHMFNQVRADLMISCIHGEKPFPKVMLDLQEEAAKYVDVSSPFWIMGVLGTQSANLLMSVRENKKAAQVSWSTLLDRAIALECDFQQLLNILSTNEPYTITLAPGRDRDIIYRGRYDLYADFWAIRLWNNFRSLRMIVCQIQRFLIHKILGTDADVAQRQYLESRLDDMMHILSSYGDEILATVPQALEFLSHEPGSSGWRVAAFHANVSGGYILAWSLAMVGKSPATGSEAREWVIQCLRGIGRKSGLLIALDIAEEIAKLYQPASI